MPTNDRISFPVATSQRRKVLSPLPDKANLPFGEKATELTKLVCPKNDRISFPVATSQRTQGFVTAP